MDNWKVGEVDILLLASAVVAGFIETNILMPNMVELNRIAKASKGSEKIPGVTFVNNPFIR